MKLSETWRSQHQLVILFASISSTLLQFCPLVPRRYKEMCFINTSLFHLAHLITKISQGQENLALQKMRQTAQVCEYLLLFVFVFIELLFEADFPATTSQTSGTPRLRQGSSYPSASSSPYSSASAGFIARTGTIGRFQYSIMFISLAGDDASFTSLARQFTDSRSGYAATSVQDYCSSPEQQCLDNLYRSCVEIP